MSNEKTQAIAIIPRTLDEVRTLSESLSKSTLLPDAMRNKASDILVSILAGQELGLPPMAAIRGVHVVQGKPILAADTMVGLVLGSGVADYFACVEESNASVTYETRRHGAPQPQRATWTMDDARRAGLGGQNWAKYPRAMLKARCKAALARDVYPDVLAGCYEESERDEVARERGPSSAPRHIDVPDAEVVSETPAGKDLLQRIEDAGSIAELEALVPELSALTTGKGAARKAYGERKKALAAGNASAAEPEPA